MMYQGIGVPNVFAHGNQSIGEELKQGATGDGSDLEHALGLIKA